MAQSTQTLIPQRMNQDVDERALKQDECRRKLNLRTGLTDGSNAMGSENFKGMQDITNPYYEVGDVIIGSFEDISNDSIIYFVYNPDITKNKIFRYFPFEEVVGAASPLLPAGVGQGGSYSPKIELVLKHSYLNFKLDHKITDIDVIGGILYWTDGYFNSYLNNDYNPPRKLNIAKAVKFTQKYRGDDRWNFQTIAEASGYFTNPEYVGMTVFISNEEYRHTVGAKVVSWCPDGDFIGCRYKKATGYGVVINRSFSGGTYKVLTDRPWQEINDNVAMDKPGHMLTYATDCYFGIDWQVLDAIKWPPSLAPSASYIDDASIKVNKLRNNLFQFCYRWVYDDHEKSVFSPISVIPLPSVPELLNGAYDETTVKDNVINVWTDTGPMEVVSIELAVRKGNTGNRILINRKHKYDQDGDCILNSDIYAVYEFYNNEVGEPLDQDDASRPFDFVPQIAGRQELIEKNRLLYGDYVEGYDNIDIDASLSIIKEEFDTGMIINTVTYGPYYPPTYGGQYFWSEWLMNHFYTDSEFDTYSCSIIDIRALYDRGGIAVIRVGCQPYTYKNIHNTVSYPTEYLGRGIGGIAVVDTSSNTFEKFRTSIIVQLRYSGLRSSVIAFSPDDQSGYSMWGGYIRIEPNGGIWLPSPYMATRANIIYVVAQSFDLEAGLGQEPSYAQYHMYTRKTNTGDDFYKALTFMSGSAHRFGLVYFDRAGRSGAVQVNDDTSIYIPFQSENTPGELRRHEIRWQINHLPPAWSTQYAWVYAPNGSFSYAIYASVRGFAAGRKAGTISLDINTDIGDTLDIIESFNILPYEWQRGDRVRFCLLRIADNKYRTVNGYYDYEILGSYIPAEDEQYYIKNRIGDLILDENGNKILDVSLSRILIKDINYAFLGFTDQNVIVQIYRPIRESDEVVYSIFSPIYEIRNPHTIERRHGVVIGDVSWDRVQTNSLSCRGTFDRGDGYIYKRFAIEIYSVESDQFSDFYDSNVISIGRPNVENRDMRRQHFISYQRYSEVFIENTLTNGLSTFQAKNYDTLPEKYDSIYGFAESGDVLRVLQKNKCTSIYIGKSGLKQAQLEGGDLVTISDSVIGTKMFRPEGFGTVFPESISQSVNSTYFFDIYNECWCRWSNNGIQQITRKESRTGWDYGMGIYFRNKCKSLLTSGIENVRVYSIFEREFENLIVTFIDKANPENNETILFHEPTNSWTTFASFTPENYGQVGLVITSSKDGKLYLHNVNSYRNYFYGVNYPSEIHLVSNENPGNIKVYDSLEIMTNSKEWEAPDAGDIYVNEGVVTMLSRIKKQKFTRREGKQVSAFGKDMSSSGAIRTSDIINGRPLRGHAINMKLRNTDTKEVTIFGLNIHSTISE